MLKSENAIHRSEAARALKNWSTPESVPGLLKALTTDPWPPVRVNAIEALSKYHAQRRHQTRGATIGQHPDAGRRHQVLKSIGPEAEDAVLPYLEHKDAWVRAASCGILEALGTQEITARVGKSRF